MLPLLCVVDSLHIPLVGGPRSRLRPMFRAVPFSSFEEALGRSENRHLRSQIEDAARMAEKDPSSWLKEVRFM